MEPKTSQKISKKKSSKKKSTKKKSSRPTTQKPTTTNTNQAGTSKDLYQLKQRAIECDVLAGRQPGGQAIEGTVERAADPTGESIAGCKLILENFAWAMAFLNVEYPPEFIEQGAPKLANLLEQPYIKKYIGNSTATVGRSSPEIEALMFFGPYAFMTYKVLTVKAADDQSSLANQAENLPDKKNPEKKSGKTGFEDA